MPDPDRAAEGEPATDSWEDDRLFLEWVDSDREGAQQRPRARPAVCLPHPRAGPLRGSWRELGPSRDNTPCRTAATRPTVWGCCLSDGGMYPCCLPPRCSLTPHPTHTHATAPPHSSPSIAQTSVLAKHLTGSRGSLRDRAPGGFLEAPLHRRPRVLTRRRGRGGAQGRSAPPGRARRQVISLRRLTKKRIGTLLPLLSPPSFGRRGVLTT